MGSFAASEQDPDAWRRWLCWHGDLRLLRFVAAGVAPEILGASTDDVAELSADLDNARLSAADFDRRHRTRLARVWTVEAPGQADFVLAQLGTGTWANDTFAPCAWGNLRRGRTHRFRNPWTPAELEAALNRNGPQRPANAPMGMLAQIREAAKAPPAGTPGPVTPPVFPAGGAGGTGQAAAVGAPAPGGCGGGLRLPRALVKPPPGSVSSRADMGPPWGSMRWPPARTVRPTGLPPSRLGSATPPPPRGPAAWPQDGAHGPLLPGVR